MNVIIKELKTKKEMLPAFPLIGQMYPQLSVEKFSAALDEMILRDNYKIIAAFSDGKMVGVSGYFVSYMFYCGRYLQACNFFVEKQSRKSGVGKKILDYLEEKARQKRCERFVLDSYTENKLSHPLFFREGFYIRGLHFMKNI